MAVEPHIDSPNRPTTHWKPRAIVGVPRHLCLLDPLSSTFSRLFQRFQSATASYPARTSACQFFSSISSGSHFKSLLRATRGRWAPAVSDGNHGFNLPISYSSVQAIGTSQIEPDNDNGSIPIFDSCATARKRHIKTPTVQLKFSHNRCLSSCIYLRYLASSSYLASDL